jgi:hypothetical protein
LQLLFLLVLLLYMPSRLVQVVVVAFLLVVLVELLGVGL